MAHRVSLEVQGLLMQAAVLTKSAESAILAAPGARSAHHLVNADYHATRALALEARAKLDAALALISQADVVEFVHPDGTPAVRAPDGYVFNRRGDRVAVCIPAKE